MFNPYELILQKLTEIENRVSSTTPVVTTKDEIIDRNELCKRLGITEPTAIRWEKKGKIPNFRIGSNVRYNWKTVINTLEKKQAI